MPAIVKGHIADPLATVSMV